MSAKLAKLIAIHNEEGLIGVARRFRDKFAEKAFPHLGPKYLRFKYKPGTPLISDVLKADPVAHRYSPPSPRPKGKKLDIAWVIPPVGEGGGGHTTISRVARKLQQDGHNVTFTIYDNATRQYNSEAKPGLKKFYNLDVEMLELDELHKADAVIATSWETAYAVNNVETGPFKFYFVQDFEPSFYGIGTEYVLAEQTYRFGFYGVTAGRWLTKRVAEYGMPADYFDFGVDLDIYRLDPQNAPTRKKQIAFYARPLTERRGFELGLMALTKFHEMHPEFEIVLFGQDLSKFELTFPAKSLGVISEHELATLYQESVACLLLSLTNVSLLPLELLAAGCVPVMNDGENNRMVLGDTPGILYSDPMPTSLARRLSEAVENPDLEANALQISQSTDNRSWDTGLRQAASIIEDVTTGQAVS
jgi:glycosyltransferase involved in cell wall biosynthesis